MLDGGFNLRKWSSNFVPLTKAIKQSEISEESVVPSERKVTTEDESHTKG